MVMMVISNSPKSRLAICSPPPSLVKNKGVILIVALVMLLVMTTIGVTTMSGSTLQERMAANYREQAVAQINAEAALLSGEQFLNALAGGDGRLTLAEIEAVFGVVDGDGNTPQGLYSTKVINAVGPFPLFANVSNAASWTNANSANSIDTTATSAPLGGGGSFDITLQNTVIPPRIAIEYLGCEAEYCSPSQAGYDVDQLYYSFRIVAIGWASNINTYSVLQGMYLSRQ
jgi:type IV pilus assembly protein PilX